MTRLRYMLSGPVPIRVNSRNSRDSRQILRVVPGRRPALRSLSAFICVQPSSVPIGSGLRRTGLRLKRLPFFLFPFSFFLLNWPVRFRKITIVGVGLLGGSLGLAVRKRRLAAKIAGYVRRDASVSECQKFRAVDFATRDLRQAVADADL